MLYTTTGGSTICSFEANIYLERHNNDDHDTIYYFVVLLETQYWPYLSMSIRTQYFYVTMIKITFFIQNFLFQSLDNKSCMCALAFRKKKFNRCICNDVKDLGPTTA